MAKLTKNKIPIHNERILELIYEAKLERKLMQKQVYALIGASANNDTAYKAGTIKFTVDQVIASAKEFNVSIDWICGLSTTREPIKSVPPLEKIKRAVKELEDMKKLL
jgi:hypothetical protein